MRPGLVGSKPRALSPDGADTALSAAPLPSPSPRQLSLRFSLLQGDCHLSIVFWVETWVLRAIKTLNCQEQSALAPSLPLDHVALENTMAV